jgi:DNA gyrase subunit A
MMPVVMPTRIPNLLVNGSTGIAVGMATNIPPHNLGEIIDGVLAVIENPEVELAELMQLIPGPDFPTAGIINGRGGIVKAYKTGRGRIYVRAKADVETSEKNGRQAIIVHELPYQVNKARLLEKIGELVRDKKVEGITGLRDESDKQGMRMVIEVRRGDNAEVVLNNLYAHTQLQVVYGINIVALDKGQPRVLNLKQLLKAFVDHRREVVTRRCVFDLRKARERIHILEGLEVALANIDVIITLIKAAKSPAEAKAQLLGQVWPQGSVAELLEISDPKQTRPQDLLAEFGMHDDGYHLSPQQAQAILDLRLHRLTGLEKDKIHDEYTKLVELIKELIEILSNPDRLHEVIRNELAEIKERFNDERRTLIIESKLDLTHEDLIEEEDLVVTLSRAGYIKSQSLDSYQSQKRGGKGKIATSVRDEDFVKRLLIAHSHDTILCFSTEGKVYWMKTYQVPQASRTARGRPIVNILPLEKDEHISFILPVKEYDADHFVFMATAKGTVKKVPLTEFSRPRSNGKIALDLVDGDRLIGVDITDGKRDIMLISSAGKAIRFKEEDVRAMGRTARGVRGIKLQKDQMLISLIIPTEGCTILTATEHGYGQRTTIDAYRAIGRGGQGVQAIQVNERNGNVIGACQVCDDDEALLITTKGTMVRIEVKGVSVIGRNTQGVRLIRLSEGEHLVAVEPVIEK